MPYPNEHSCRLKPPNYKRYSRKNCYQKHEGKCIDFIFGINAPNESELQAMRYKTSIWTAADARKHCEDNDGSFEEAAGEESLAENRWYSMKAEADEAEISIFGEIGGWAGVTVSDFKKDLDAIRGKKRIKLLLNSPGGDPFEGIAIYNLLARDRSKLEVQVLGLAASAASIVALAGQELIMSRGSYFMIHSPTGFCIGDAADMQKMADGLGKIAGQMAKIYAGESNLSREEALAAMAEETWYTADEAMEAGFADSVVDYGDVAALAPNIDRFGYAHVPEALRELAARQTLTINVLHVQVPKSADAAPLENPENPPAISGAGGESDHAEEEDMKTMKQILEAFAALPEEERTKATEEEKKKVAENLGITIPVDNSKIMEDLQAKAQIQDEKIVLLLKENEAKAKELADMKLEKFKAEKTQAIEKALAEGKIAPVNRALWEEQYDKDSEGTRKLLKSQQPVVDFSERGVSTGGEEKETMSETERKYHKELGHTEEDIKRHGGKI